MSDALGHVAASDEVLVTCKDLVIGYHGRALLPPINLSLRSGQFWAVVGRNGSGKSTWLRTVLGIEQPVSGAVERRRGADRFAYVAQAAELDPLLPVQSRDVVAWGRQRGWSFLRPFASRADRERCAAALVHAEADAFRMRRYGELSVGQKQRVLFARMLATDADVVFLDEPTAAMDMVAEREVMQQLSHLARDHDRAVVLVTHYIGLAGRYADKMLFLDVDNKIVMAGNADAIMRERAFRDRYGRFLEEHGG